MGWEVDTVSATNSGEMGAPGEIPSTDQRAKRAYALYTDQHGRPWGAVIENKTGDPCGPLEPQFQAPMMPNDKYITINSRQRKVFIRYEEILKDIEDADNDWDTQLRDWARKTYGTAAPAAIKNPPPELLDIVGPKPRERKEPWEAAMQGNKWMLGLSPNKPEWALEFFPNEAPKQRDNKPTLSGRKFEDAPEDQVEEEEVVGGIQWAGKGGWKLPDGTKVPRNEDETPEDHRRRALAMIGVTEED